MSPLSSFEFRISGIGSWSSGIGRGGVEVRREQVLKSFLSLPLSLSPSLSLPLSLSLFHSSCQGESGPRPLNNDRDKPRLFVFKAHGLLYHSTLGLKVKTRKETPRLFSGTHARANCPTQQTPLSRHTSGIGPKLICNRKTRPKSAHVTLESWWKEHRWMLGGRG